MTALFCAGCIGVLALGALLLSFAEYLWPERRALRIVKRQSRPESTIFLIAPFGPVGVRRRP